MVGKTEFENLVNNALEAMQAARELRATAPDVAFTETLTFNGTGLFAGFEDFGAEWTEVVMAPTGYKGRVMSVNINGIVETFNEVSAGATVYVGTASDTDAYATAASIGTAAAATPASPAVTHINYIPGGALFQITGNPSDHGTPAGRARCAVTIAWIKETA